MSHQLGPRGYGTIWALLTLGIGLHATAVRGDSGPHAEDAWASPAADCNTNGMNDQSEIAAGTSADCNANGVPDDCDVAGATRSYNIPLVPPAAIEDLGALTRTFTVAAAGEILDVDVGVHIAHTWIGDLTITLTHDPASVLVFNRSCGSVNDLNGTVFDDETSAQLPCASGNAGTYPPASPLSAFDGLDAAGDWSLSISDLAGGDDGQLVGWSLHIKTAATSADCNSNAIPDECDGGCVPAATVTGAVSRKPNAAGPGGVCDLPLVPGARTEPRQGGITELRIAFDVAPGSPDAEPITLEQATCAAPAYVAYAGISTHSAIVQGNDLVLTFSPALENGRSYRVQLNASITGVAGQAVEVRGLVGDVNQSGFTNGNDRSVVIGVWTGPGGFSCLTDLNSSGATNGNDRSIVIGAWTGTQNCAP